MRIKDIAVISVFVGILAALSVLGLLIPDKDVSESERRHLAQFATYAEKRQEAADKGKDYGIRDYFAFLETYSLDQFPARDTFRSLKSCFKLNVLRQKDNNGYYSVNGNLSKLDAVMNKDAVVNSASRFNVLYNKYFKPLNANAYYCVVPDKNYFLAEQNGYLHYDYDEFYKKVADTVKPDIKEIDIKKLLSAEHYYKTDPHWDESKLLSVADKILLEMGAKVGISDIDFEVKSIENFYGTYYGQLALPVPPDTMKYLTSEEFSDVTVYNYLTGKTGTLYNEEKFGNVDPYDLFLDGAVPLLKIENPNSIRKKQLVVFRDSFGSSIIPLFLAEYDEIIAVDIRYMSPDSLAASVRFNAGCDVLFLYSTSVLNTYGVFMN